MAPVPPRFVRHSIFLQTSSRAHLLDLITAADEPQSSSRVMSVTAA